MRRRRWQGAERRVDAMARTPRAVQRKLGAWGLARGGYRGHGPGELRRPATQDRTQHRSDKNGGPRQAIRAMHAKENPET